MQQSDTLNPRRIILMKNKTIIALLSIAFTLAGCSQGKKESPKTDSVAQSSALMTVEKIKPTSKTVQGLIKSSGVIAPVNEVSVSSEIGGQKLSLVYADVGQYVKKGQILAKLNTDLLEKDIVVAEAALKKSKAALELSTFNYENSKKLRQSSSISEQELMQSKAQYLSNLADSSQYEGQLDGLRIKQKYANISAPVSGIITSKSAIAGTIINPGVELFKIIKDSAYEWKAEVDSDNYSDLKLQQKAVFNLGDKTYEGVVSKISPSLDTSSKKLIVYVKPSSSKGLIGGAIASGNIFTQNKEVVALPESSFVFDQGKAFVFKINSGRVFKIPVQVGLRQDDYFEVLTPLALEEEFVKSGVGLLVDGDLVAEKKETK